MKKQYITKDTEIIPWKIIKMEISKINSLIEFRTKDGINFYMLTGFTSKVWKPVNDKLTLERLVQEYNKINKRVGIK